MVLVPEPSLDDDAPLLQRPPPPRTWRERVEQLADATGTTPVRIVVGAMLAAGAVMAGLWLTRAPADPVEATLPFASTTVAVASTAPTTTEATAVVVHVAGAVAAPGLHELAHGSRVADAIAAAGGLAPNADGARLNLAAPVTDGERVYVPAVGEGPPPPVVGGSSGGGSAGPGGGSVPAGPVNLNTADEAALDTLPGVGPATAAAIIEHRDKIGGFTSVEQLLDVRGIGEAKLEAMRDLVTV